ncbi:uncharacterized protein DUF1857 [Crenobacter luteus]|uniref:Polyketide cyclase n=1 Tax=Crenobacter luteus TaxID=1452487 RepID=A0A165FU54_9NEIS|nr:AtaL-like protein [Crenobacter luteus]KZE34209.1 hypothetical protein AVW16_06980 [Crenobacter luteus]TCP11211.1 uncharacterized protein DUF1857 [Crenobacter luteus]
MQFEHIVLVNDPRVDSAPLTVAQLWRGLMRRAEDPMLFMEQLEGARVTERGQDWFRRELDFGHFTVADTVHVVHEKSLRFDTEASESHPGGSLTVAIETPAPGVLCVRFSYQTGLPEQPGQEGGDASDSYFVPWVKSAYRDTDVDAIRQIRALAAAGELG